MKSSKIIYKLLVLLFLSNNLLYSQTVNLQNSGKVQIKNGQIKTKGNIVVGDDNFTTKTFPLSMINSIKHESSGNIEIYFSEENKVEIDADQNIIDLYKVNVKNGILNIQSSKSYVSNNPVTIRVYTSTLSKIVLEGAGDIDAYDIFNQSLNIILEGSGNIKVTGHTQSLKIISEGAGNIDCGNLEVENADIRLDGAGNIDVTVIKYLKIYHDGAGDINYWGSPKTSIIHEGVGDINEN